MTTVQDRDWSLQTPWLDNEQDHVIEIDCVYLELQSCWHNGLCIGNVRSHIEIVSNYREITI